MRIKFRMLAMLLGVLSVAACDSIPREALNSYVSAFGEARTAGEALTTDYRAAKAESERRDTTTAPSATVAIPLIYQPPIEAAQSAASVRLKAWQVIANYNAALAALSAGESVDDVKGAVGKIGDTAGQIASLAGHSIPGIGVIVAAGKELAELFEKARLAGEFKSTVKKGAPIVRKMLKFIVDDVPAHYQLRAAMFEEDRIDADTSTTAGKVEHARVLEAASAFKTSVDRFILLAKSLDGSLIAMEAAVDKPADFVSLSKEIVMHAKSMKTHWVAYQAARG